MIVGAYGPVVFSVSSETVRTFRTARRKRGAIFAAHDVIGRKDRIEPMKDKLDEMSLEIKLDQNLGTAPWAELELLNQLKRLKLPWPLFFGPVPAGEFVLTEIGEDWKRYTGAGVLASVDVTIDLLEDADGPLTARLSSALG